MNTFKVEITDEVINEQMQKHLSKIFAEDNYSNPIKEEMNKLFNYNGPLRDAVKAKVQEVTTTFMASPEYQDMFAKALVIEMAKEQVKLIKEKSR